MAVYNVMCAMTSWHYLVVYILLSVKSGNDVLATLSNITYTTYMAMIVRLIAFPFYFNFQMILTSSIHYLLVMCAHHLIASRYLTAFRWILEFFRTHEYTPPFLIKIISWRGKGLTFCSRFISFL